jgi:hypothetical protein
MTTWVFSLSQVLSAVRLRTVDGLFQGPVPFGRSRHSESGAFHPADRVGHLSVITSLPAVDRLSPQQRRQQSRFLVRQVTTPHRIKDRHA